MIVLGTVGSAVDVHLFWPRPANSPEYDNILTNYIVNYRIFGANSATCAFGCSARAGETEL